jgi:hypothetical protein
MKGAIIIILFLMLILPLVSADVMIAGYHSVNINNKIENINQFPNYVFISAPTEESGPGYSMCPIVVIEDDGVIPDYYKLCDISVYAVEKDRIDLQKIKDLARRDIEINETEIKSYFDSLNAKEVVKNIQVSTTVSDTSTVKEINNTYSVDVNKLKITPDNKKITRSYLVYLYIIIPILALIIIILIIYRRRK